MKFEFDQNWHGNRTPVLNAYFLPLWEGKKDLRVLEIGSFEGRSTTWWLDNMDIKEMTCVDMWEDIPKLPELKMDKIFENFKSNVGNRVNYIKSHSHDALMDMITDNKMFDFIYIDGSHMARDVLFDAILSDRLLVSGGIMLFDDYLGGGNFPEIERVKKGFDFFYNNYKSKYDIIYSEYQVCIKKK